MRGILPPEIGDLTELTDLLLWGGTVDSVDNRITGPIPPEIGKLTKLEELDVGANDVTGSLPPEFGNLTGLATLYADSTYLSGALPVEVAKIKPWLYDGDGDGQPDDTTTDVAWAISTWSAPSFGNTRGLCLGLQPEIDEWLKGDGYTGDGNGSTDTDDPFTNYTMENARCLILMETSPSHIVEPISGSKDVEVTVTAKVNHIIGAEVSLPLNALGGNAAKGSSADYSAAAHAITIPANATEGTATFALTVKSNDDSGETDANGKSAEEMDKLEIAGSASVGGSAVNVNKETVFLREPDTDLGQALFGVTSDGVAHWDYVMPGAKAQDYDHSPLTDSGGMKYEYFEIRWIETAQKAVGAGWVGKSNRVFYTDRVSNFDIPNLKAATEYKAKLFVGITANGVQRYIKSNVITFTAPRENPVIAFAVSQGLAKWSDDRSNRATYGYYEVQWKDASQSGWAERSSAIFFDRSGAFQIPGLRAGKWYTARLYAGQHPSETGVKNRHYSKEATFKR